MQLQLKLLLLTMKST